MKRNLTLGLILILSTVIVGCNNKSEDLEVRAELEGLKEELKVLREGRENLVDPDTVDEVDNEIENLEDEIENITKENVRLQKELDCKEREKLLE